MLFGWLGKTIYKVYLPDRPGRIDQQIVTTSNLVFHEKIGIRETKSEVQDSKQETTIADCIMYQPVISRSLPPNARKSKNTTTLKSFLAECLHISELPEIEPQTLEEALLGSERKE